MTSFPMTSAESAALPGTTADLGPSTVARTSPSAVPTMTRVLDPPPSTPTTISLTYVNPHRRCCVRERRKNANSDRERCADENVPRERDVRQRGEDARHRWKRRHHRLGENDEAHRNDADRHPRDGVALHGARPEHAEEEAAEQRSVCERSDGEGDHDHRRTLLLVEQRGNEEDHAPEQREHLCHLERARVIGPAPGEWQIDV